MQSISLTKTKSQRFSVTLEGVFCQFKITQKSTGLYLDLYANNQPVCLGVICLNGNRIVRYKYLRAKTGFKGELVFIDTRGSDDPEYSELDSRYKLYYFTSDEIA